MMANSPSSLFYFSIRLRPRGIYFVLLNCTKQKQQELSGNEKVCVRRCLDFVSSL
jgi:hypothetical protein